MSNTSKLAAIKKQLKKQPASMEARFQRPTPDRKKRLQLYVEPDVYATLMRHFKELPYNENGVSLQKLIGAAILGLDYLKKAQISKLLDTLCSRDLRYKANR
jgi:hypothetical protein